METGRTCVDPGERDPAVGSESFQCERLLTAAGLHDAEISRDGAGWSAFQILGPASDRPDIAATEPYVVTSLPVDFHCHGLGGRDFSDEQLTDLTWLNERLRVTGQRCVPTLFLPPQRLAGFVRFAHRFAERRARGELPLVAGLALEGPLLASFGGTPEEGNWAPGRDEWRQLCECGPLGLEYLVLSPDAPEGGAGPGVDEIVGLLLEHGIRPALGHFRKSHPEASARAIERIVEVAGRAAAAHLAPPLLTDHVFNDMPLRFRHAWRTPEERAARDRELRAARLSEWTLDNLDELAGPVPAALLRAAHAGRIMACLNFDGEHVDLDVCRRVVELVGSDSIVAITDGTDAATLGGQTLHRSEHNTLYYQDGGVVAAGSASVDRQMANMRRIGLREIDIWRMVAFNPERIVGPAGGEASGPPRIATFVDGERRRRAVL
ncbi:MAG TPA: hypothetical protein VOB72_09430 [Candidatus Dormibacteraeota bacterium]|nr:hypothetical protein [Candidatus Dormibacteraeota bacterium]